MSQPSVTVSNNALQLQLNSVLQKDGVYFNLPQLAETFETVITTVVLVYDLLHVQTPILKLKFESTLYGDERISLVTHSVSLTLLTSAFAALVCIQALVYTYSYLY